MSTDAPREPLDLAPKSFTLKPLVVARLLAEISACIIVIALPVVAVTPLNKYVLAPTTMAALVLLSIAAAFLLASYGFITYKVAVGEDGLKLLSAYKKQEVAWSEMTSLGLKTSFGWRRYLIATTGDSATFPIWLTNVQELVQIIRSRLPNRGRSEAARSRVFRQHSVGLVMQLGKLVLTVGFIILFWWFFVSLVKSARHDQGDIAIILGACLILTLLMLWRIWLIVFMPRSVELTDDGLRFTTWFFERPALWSETRLVNAPPLLLPEGELLKTPAGWFLLSADLEAFDELQYEVAGQLEKYAVKKTS